MLLEVLDLLHELFHFLFILFVDTLDFLIVIFTDLQRLIKVNFLNMEGSLSVLGTEAVLIGCQLLLKLLLGERPRPVLNENAEIGSSDGFLIDHGLSFFLKVLNQKEEQAPDEDYSDPDPHLDQIHFGG